MPSAGARPRNCGPTTVTQPIFTVSGAAAGAVQDTESRRFPMSTTRTAQSPRTTRRCRRGALIAAGALAAMPLLAACQVDVSAAETSHPKTNPVIDIVGNETHVDLSTTHLPDGFNEVHFHAGDDGEHGLVILQLKAGVTINDILPAMATNDMVTVLQKSSPVGGTDVLSPSETWRMVTDLSPGNYAAVDIGQVADESSNFSHGAVATFTVDKTSGSPGNAPEDAVDVKTGDFYFKLPPTLPRQGVLRFHNVGKQVHAATIVRLNPGVTAEEGKAAALSGDDKNFPGVEVSGLNVFASGRTD